MKSEITEERRLELEGYSEGNLSALRDKLHRDLEEFRAREERAELIAALARRRALRWTGDVLAGPRLDRRIETMFDAFRERRRPWPMGEVVRVFDGLVGRLVSRRLWLALIGLATIIPAITSLILLATQNGDQIEKNRVEQMDQFLKTRTELTDVIHAVTRQSVVENGESRVVTLPVYHSRLRVEAFSSLIAIEKQRWSAAEREATPPVRYVNLRNGDYRGLVLGERIGIDESEIRTDFTRIFLGGSDLTGAHLLNCRLDGSVFQGCRGEGMTIVSPSVDGADFTGFQGQGMRFEHNAKTGDPLSMRGTKFDRANLRNARFVMASAANASFDGTDLTGVDFEDSGFMGCDFTTAALGDSADWSRSRFHKCLVTVDQAGAIRLPEYCFFREGPRAGTREIMTDVEKYEAWYAKHSAELRAAAIEELKALGVKPEDFPDHLK